MPDRVLSRGTNNDGNHYDTRMHTLTGERGYHYSKDDSYYYKNTDGSTYYNSGDGYARHTTASGSVTEYTGSTASGSGSKAKR